jgi:hypothetical protein
MWMMTVGEAAQLLLLPPRTYLICHLLLHALSLESTICGLRPLDSCLSHDTYLSLYHSAVPYVMIPRRPFVLTACR